MKRFAVFTTVAALGLAASVQAATIYPANNGFEVPDFQGTAYSTGNPVTASTSPDAYDYSNDLPSSVASWTFTGSTGIANNQSGFSVSGAHNGNSDATISKYGQAAFIQTGTNTNSISQSISGFSTGTASVSFSIEARDADGQTNPITVTLDGVSLGTYSTLSRSFVAETTPVIPITAGSHTLTFTGLTQGGDHTSFIDDVSVTNAVPEPATLGVASLALLGLLARRRR